MRYKELILRIVSIIGEMSGNSSGSKWYEIDHNQKIDDVVDQEASPHHSDGGRNINLRRFIYIVGTMSILSGLITNIATISNMFSGWFSNFAAVHELPLLKSVPATPSVAPSPIPTLPDPPPSPQGTVPSTVAPPAPTFVPIPDSKPLPSTLSETDKRLAALLGFSDAWSKHRNSVDKEALIEALHALKPEDKSFFDKAT